MYAVSEKFLAAMESRPYIAKITLDGTDIIQGDPIKTITFRGGTNGDDIAVSIGSAVSASVEVLLNKSLVTVPVAGRTAVIELGIDIDGVPEWLPMGEYTIGDVTENDGTITMPGMDAMAAKFDVDYDPIPGFDFTKEGGVGSTAFLAALCERRGVPVDVSGLPIYSLNMSPVGYTERQIIGMIAALYGRFANIDRDGVLRFHWYIPVDVKVTADNYYESGLEKASYDFTAEWLQSYKETMEDALIVGDENAMQGIYFQCLWMTEDILSSIWESLQGFAYRPVSELSFLGDPRLDPGDVITLEDADGESHIIPVMVLSHEYDGGLKTEISAKGQMTTDSQDGPVMGEVKRSMAKIVEEQEAIKLSVNSLDGRFSKIEETAGQVSVAVGTPNGTLKTEISSTPEVKWEAKYVDADGNTLSGFYFDFEKKQFIFDGSGKFSGELNIGDGNFVVDVNGNVTAHGNTRIYGGRYYAMGDDGTGGYTAMEQTGFVIYNAAGQQLIKVGYPADHDQYPYIILSSSENGSTIYKRFDDGAWLGNDAPAEAYGEFNPQTGYAGIFISNVDGKTYVVSGTNMKNIYTGEAIARFG